MENVREETHGLNVTSLASYSLQPGDYREKVLIPQEVIGRIVHKFEYEEDSYQF